MKALTKKIESEKWKVEDTRTVPHEESLDRLVRAILCDWQPPEVDVLDERVLDIGMTAENYVAYMTHMMDLEWRERHAILARFVDVLDGLPVDVTSSHTFMYCRNIYTCFTTKQ